MAENNLSILLREAAPQLNPGTYVFTTMDSAISIPHTDVLMSFREAEGTTLILEQSVADKHGLPYEYEAAWITMTVNSALEAVGFTAAFATALGKHGISCNVVAALHHDHLFVALRDAEQALVVLDNL